MMAGLHDFFSIDILARTLFSPFRQIAAEKINGPFAVMIRAFFDNLISRVIGFFVRMIIIFAGVFVMMLASCGALVWLVFWACVPALPIIGFMLFVGDWLPWR